MTQVDGVHVLQRENRGREPRAPTDNTHQSLIICSHEVFSGQPLAHFTGGVSGAVLSGPILQTLVRSVDT